MDKGMYGHLFFCVFDRKTGKYYNKVTNRFDLDDSETPPLMTLGEAEEIQKSGEGYQICFHEET